MDRRLFRRFCELAHDKAGIALKEGKESLVEARVAKRIRALKLDSPNEYFELLESDNSGEEIVQFLDAISTNFTYFFREGDHFEFLKAEIKKLALAGRKRIRLWSAASSSGEEPYSMAISCIEALGGAPVNFKILATDISTKVLGSAEAGIYPVSRTRGLDKPHRTKYFRRLGRRDSKEERFEVRPEVREKIVFRRLNLAKPPFPMKGPLDGVFCRNVMIYFDNPVRQQLVAEFERLLHPGGFLVVGHAEGLHGVNGSFEIIRPSVYRKPEAQHESEDTVYVD